MKLADLIARIRLDVNDIDRERWEDVHIVDMVNEAYCEVFNLRPDLFEKRVIAKLDEGEMQQVCCCSQIKSVEALTDANGVKIADWREVDDSATKAFGRSRCGVLPDLPTGYKLEHESNRFTVSPPVRPGQTVFVSLVCSVRPEKLGFDVNQALDHFGCAYYGALVDYVLFRLFGTETESAVSAQRSAGHYRMFYDRLSLHEKKRKQYRQEADKAV
ncbi:phage adaptor protein [Neisseria animalis]|uniref:Phage protein n=1 Tax=Neisseria animalis TaxID=492 RepID=A0A5P3MT41_NEIAN|nr:DUF6682 family protein [Neisseria animalis]QEY24786.1 hypothetical protein D0T90_10170 [Neisseria animalis]ROW31543.1 hypothetical protein CGZ60_09825 [Neisseria animalis]VEE07713.1 Uncharacterised protein [Neisseria animalis]